MQHLYQDLDNFTIQSVKLNIKQLKGNGATKGAYGNILQCIVEYFFKFVAE